MKRFLFAALLVGCSSSSPSQDFHEKVKMGSAGPVAWPPALVLSPPDAAGGQKAVEYLPDGGVNWYTASGGGTTISPLTPDGGMVTCNGTACATQGVTYTPGTGVVTFPSAATAPGLVQASESATQTPTPMVDVPQVSTHATNQDGSSRGFAISAPLGDGAEGSVYGTRAGNPLFALGEDGNGGPQALWLGGTGTNNWVIANYDQSATVIRSGAAIELYGGSVIQGYITATSFLAETSFYVGPDPAVLGGGTHVIGIANGTSPTTACTGGVCLGAVSAVGTIATSEVFDVDTIQPVTLGTHNTQVQKFLATRSMCRSVGSPGCNFAATAIPTTSTCNISITISSRCVSTTGGTCTTGDGFVSVAGAFGIKNIGGTASALASGMGYSGANYDASQTSNTVAAGFSGGSLTLQAEPTSGDGTVDWTAEVRTFCN